jgi:uncharacterized protein YndB with AHSA1/START domain
MKVIECSTRIARTPQEVFDYVTDATRLPEWQPTVEEAGAEPPGVRQVGMIGYEVRHVPGGPRRIRWRVTECEPAARWSVEGVDGPVRAHVSISMAPSGAAGTQVGYRIWFEGHGIGRLIRVMAARGARADAPAGLERLRQRLEGAAAPSRHPATN